MKKRIDKSGPSAASLREMPEIDFENVKVLGRGLHHERAKRSFAQVVIERTLFDRFGSNEAVIAALRSIVEAAEAMRPTRPNIKRAHRSGTKRHAA